MNSCHKMFIFNRFPIDKEYFFNLLKIVNEEDHEIFSYLYTSPRIFDKIYFTMSDRELASVANRRGDPELVNCFREFDAACSLQGRCIVLHIPAMSEKISNIQLRSDDPEGEILFTLHFFGCLFHELGHAYHYTRLIVNAAFGNVYDPGARDHNDEEGERYADECEVKQSQQFFNVLKTKGIHLKEIANRLFYWQRLKPLVLLPRNCKDLELEQEKLRIEHPLWGKWPVSNRELMRLVWSMPTVEVAKLFGISDVAIAKRCKIYGVPKPPVGFWAKVKAGKIPHPNGVPYQS